MKSQFVQKLMRKRILLVAASVLVLAGLGVGGMYLFGKGPFTPAASAEADDHAGHEGHEHEGSHEHEGGEHPEHEGEHGDHAAHERHVVLPKNKWRSAGIEIRTAQPTTFQQKLWVTGKLTVNEDRTAHIYPLVEGRVHTVNVRFGQEVKAGDVLAIVDSREVGDAKLALYQNRLESRIAGVNADWAKKINDNTQQLIEALEKKTPLAELGPMFQGKPMGEYRQQLLGSYADLHKAKADYDRLKPLTEKGITSGAELIAAKAAYEAAQAKFQAWLEQLAFTAWQNSLHKQQMLDKAESQQRVSRSKLYILGYSPDDLEQVDPGKEGETISHYRIRAPFDGTILSKDVVLQERVGPDTQLFELSDLSTLWVQADVYQKHLPALKNLTSGTVRFRSAEYGHVHQAQVFYRGDVLDPKTRTARLMALVDNPDGHLKPGMFVEVELPGAVRSDVTQVPRTAVIEEQGETFVFVQSEPGSEEFERRDVELGQASDGTVRIAHGLKPGDRVVVGGLFALKTAMQGEVASTHSH